ncbi:MAG TPA: hypothetical protein DEO26_00250 [Candidatus Veblenbacteria bacterium]|nr:MAG: hypothetical protein UV69_C0014G0009 [Parcubacteria group bacterium GW2011_GWE2_43_12]HBZ36152.1 hypothetical protein [Candidatus Veblenbacteria bacterium]
MKRIYYLLIGGVILLAAGWLLSFNHQAGLSVTFFDVGQGDAALIRTAEGQNILIDGGPSRSILSKLGAYLPWTDRTIDLVILSHPHADHVTGLNHVLENYQVNHVLISGALHTTSEYLRFLELIKEKNIPITIALAGQTFTLNGGVNIEVLWPIESLAQKEFTDLNESSIVNKVTYGDTAILFTGDTPLENEEAVLQSGQIIKADILKVAHQGSKTSSGDNFIKAVSPQVAVISVGNNNYGHPNADTVARLKSLVPVVLRTDEAGDITYISNGQSFTRERGNLIFSKSVLP